MGRFIKINLVLFFLMYAFATMSVLAEGTVYKTEVELWDGGGTQLDIGASDRKLKVIDPLSSISHPGFTFPSGKKIYAWMRYLNSNEKKLIIHIGSFQTELDKTGDSLEWVALGEIHSGDKITINNQGMGPALIDVIVFSDDQFFQPTLNGLIALRVEELRSQEKITTVTRKFFKSEVEEWVKSKMTREDLSGNAAGWIDSEVTKNFQLPDKNEYWLWVRYFNNGRRGMTARVIDTAGHEFFTDLGYTRDAFGWKQIGSKLQDSITVTFKGTGELPGAIDLILFVDDPDYVPSGIPAGEDIKSANQVKTNRATAVNPLGTEEFESESTVDKSKIVAAYGGLGIGSLKYLEYARQLVHNGFNTYSLKVPADIDLNDTNTITFLKQVAVNLKSLGLDLILYIYPEDIGKRNVNGVYHAFVDKSGRLHPDKFCLYQKELWVKHLFYRIIKLAELMRNTPLRAVGLDIETIVNTERCYCDNCWQLFIRANNLAAANGIPAGERYGWLKNHQLLTVYESWQVETFNSVIENFLLELAKSNPSVSVAVMPAEFNFMVEAFARQSRNVRINLILDSWVMYGGGYREAVKEIKERWKSFNPSAIFVPWLRINNYYAKDIGIQAYYAAINTDGYNLWQIVMIGPEDTSGLPSMYHLPKGEKKDDYWQSFQIANKELQKYIEANGDYTSSLIWAPPTPIAPPIDYTNINIPELLPLSLVKIENPPTATGLRGQNVYYIFSCGKDDPIKFKIKHLAGTARPNVIAYVILNADGILVDDGLVYPSEDKDVEVLVPNKGTYGLVVSGGEGGAAWYSVTIYNRWYNLYGCPAYFFGTVPRQYFYVPSDVESFEVNISLEQKDELAEYRIYSPDENVVESDIIIYPDSRKISVSVPKEFRGKIWSLEIGPPQNYNGSGYWQAAFVSLKQIPTFFSDRPDAILVFRGRKESLE